MTASGVPLIDRAVGPLAPGAPLVVSGPSGGGRTVLALQLAAAALARNERVLFLTGEPPDLLLQQGASLALELETPLREGRLILLELDADAASHARSHGGAALARALRAEAPDADLLVIDPFSDLTTSLLEEPALRGFVRSLFRDAAQNGTNVVLSLDEAAMEQSEILRRTLRVSCGAFVSLAHSEDGGRLLTVEKSRRADVNADPYPFVIGSGGLTPCAADPGSGDESDSVRQKASTSDAPPCAKARRESILVVDDDEATRKLLCTWLGERYDVTAVGDGFAAVTAVLKHSPDLLMLDLNMPRVDGFEVLKALRGAGATLPILVFSGFLARATDRLRVLVLGATDQMRKPLQQFELEQKIETLLRLRGSNPAALPDPEEVDDLLAGTSGMRQLDLESFRDRMCRAAHFGEQFGLASSLVGVQGRSADALDQLVGAAQRVLRSEDAVTCLTKRRAVFLLVSTQTDLAGLVLGRVINALEEAGGSSESLRWNAAPATADADFDFDLLFADLQPWPSPGDD